MNTARVRIEKHGPSGKITYTEARGRAHVSDAELGGNDVMLCIYAPAPTEWAARTPWPADERRAVLEDLARRVARQEGLGSNIRLSSTGVGIYERRPWWRWLWR